VTHAYLYFLSLIAARTVIVFASCVIGLRFLGKRQIGQINIYDLAMIMALANAVQNAMTSGTGNLTTGIVCASVLLCLGRLITGLLIKWPKLETNLCGCPTLVINDGVEIEAHLRSAGITSDQLHQSLRQHGYTNASKVRLAVLEIDGTLSVVPYAGQT
jgi:uncharacterized membrane protein YcaP (DUF421 family)